MKVNPLGDRILVKEVSSEETTKSGIFLPDTAEKKKSGIYEVIALGDGEAAKMFKIGQKVVAGKYSGEEIEMKNDKDTEYKILFVGKEKNESDILALVE
jgi:chaperonin GroES